MGQCQIERRVNCFYHDRSIHREIKSYLYVKVPLCHFLFLVQSSTGPSDSIISGNWFNYLFSYTPVAIVSSQVSPQINSVT